MFIEVRQVIVQHPERGLTRCLVNEQATIEGVPHFLVWIADTVDMDELGDVIGEHGWVPVDECSLVH